MWIRGFYPRGGGEVHVSLKSVGRLSPVVLTDRGEVMEVMVEIYRAGAVHPKARKNYLLLSKGHLVVMLLYHLVCVFRQVCDQMLRSAQ